MRPPERIHPQNLVLLEILSDAPALVERQRVSVFLKKRVDPGHAAVPRILEIFQG